MKLPAPFDWSGRTIACLASGPSLTVEDCETIRAAGLTTIVTNNTWARAPWADVLLVHDAAWLKLYLADVQVGFGGQVFSCSGQNKPGVKSLTKWPFFRAFGNSGAAAISLAAYCGATRVLLLGFDCQHTGGQTHWHGSHPAPLGDARSVAKWPLKFARVADFAKKRGCVVINATRETALTCFKRQSLDEALNAA